MRFYKVLAVAIEMRGAQLAVGHDLSQPETLAIRLLPVLLVVTQFLHAEDDAEPWHGSGTAENDDVHAAGVGLHVLLPSAGLVLYWLTGNLVGIVQQWLLNRSTPAPAVFRPAR